MKLIVEDIVKLIGEDIVKLIVEDIVKLQLFLNDSTQL
jgi:hypothetical protein